MNDFSLLNETKDIINIKKYKTNNIKEIINKIFKKYEENKDETENLLKLKHIYFNSYSLVDKKKKINIIIFNMFKLKPNLTFLNKDECKLNMTPGIVLKKLNLKEKNLKKDMKIINYMIKVTFNNLDIFFKKNSFIINLIGLNKNYFRILKFFKKNTLTKKNFFLINTNNNIIIKNWKKKKSIKKKFLKKNIKN